MTLIVCLIKKNVWLPSNITFFKGSPDYFRRSVTEMDTE